MPRERAERLIKNCVRSHLFDPGFLAEMEKLHRGAQAPVVDYSARLATLDVKTSPCAFQLPFAYQLVSPCPRRSQSLHVANELHGEPLPVREHRW